MIVCISETGHKITAVVGTSEISNGAEKWFEGKAKEHNLTYLLVHADDGIIWGKMQNGGMHLSKGVYGPELRSMTIQTAYLFGESGELFLWKNDNMSWNARLVEDGLKEGDSKKIEYYDECHLMWGDTIDKNKDGFALLRQGSEGLRHAPPLDIKSNNICYPKLKLRHYLNYDEDGQAYIKFSRLVSIISEKEVNK